MFKLKYRNSVSIVEVSFDEYMDLVYFVASNKIKDEDVVSITLFDEEMDLNGLATKVMSNIEAYKTAHDDSLNTEELDWEDDENADEDDDELSSDDVRDEVLDTLNDVFSL